MAADDESALAYRPPTISHLNLKSELNSGVPVKYHPFRDHPEGVVCQSGIWIGPSVYFFSTGTAGAFLAACSSIIFLMFAACTLIPAACAA